MKKIKLFIDRYWVITLLVLMLLFSFVCLFSVKMPFVKAAEVSDGDAEDEEVYPYSLTYEFISDQGIQKNPYYIQTATLYSKNPLFIYLFSEHENVRYYRVGAFDGEKCGAVLSGKDYDTVVAYYMKYTMNRDDDSVRGSVGTDINPDYNYLTDATYIPVYGDRNFESDSYVFDSLESAEAYYLTGNKDGLVYEPDGSLVYDPDLDSARDSSQTVLIDFKADSSISCSWSGLDGATTIDTETGKQVPATTNNAFVAFEFGISSYANPGKAFKIVKHDKYIRVSKGSMHVDSSKILNSSTCYLLYVKATPYTYSGDDINGRLRKGYSSYIYFNSDGKPSWVDTTKDQVGDDDSLGDGRRRGKVDLPDFYLKNVQMKKGFLNNISETISDVFSLGKVTIFWSGTTKDTDLLLVPDGDTVVVVTYIVTNPDYSYSVKTYDTCTIGKGKIYIDYNKLITESEKNNYAWDGDIWLSPCYTVNGLLYTGQPTVVKISDGTVKRPTPNDDGSIGEEDVTPNPSNPNPDNSSDNTASDLLSYGKTFTSFLNSLIASLGALPALFSAVFSFLPSIYYEIFGVLLIVVLILRILGR